MFVFCALSLFLCPFPLISTLSSPSSSSSWLPGAPHLKSLSRDTENNMERTLDLVSRDLSQNADSVHLVAARFGRSIHLSELSLILCKGDVPIPPCPSGCWEIQKLSHTAMPDKLLTFNHMLPTCAVQGRCTRGPKNPLWVILFFPVCFLPL